MTHMTYHHDPGQLGEEEPAGQRGREAASARVQLGRPGVQELRDRAGSRQHGERVTSAEGGRRRRRRDGRIIIYYLAFDIWIRCKAAIVFWDCIFYRVTCRALPFVDTKTRSSGYPTGSSSMRQQKIYPRGAMSPCRLNWLFRFCLGNFGRMNWRNTQVNKTESQITIDTLQCESPFSSVFIILQLFKPAPSTSR